MPPAGRVGTRRRAADFLSFLAIAPPRRFDCVLEAKRKDLALFRLRRVLARAGAVEEGLARAA